MKALTFILPLVFLAVAGPGLAQSRDYTAGVQASSQRVIIPWTHFGQDPPAAVAPEPPPQTAAPPPAVTQPDDIAATPVSGSAPSDEDPSAQPSSGTSTAKVYEADISQNHPHPAEPVDLPLADQNTAPILKTLPDGPELEFQAPAALGKAGNGSVAATLKAQDHSPEGQIAQLMAAYEQREAERKTQREHFEAAGARDPATQALAEIEATRLVLEGERDRGATSRQLAKAFASLGEELDARAQKIRDLVESRKQTALTAEAELNELNQVVPRRELALRNLAMLPASTQNDQIIHGLNTELAQEEAGRRLDEEQTQEAQSEIKALQAEADELERAAAEARRKSSSFADAAQSAQVNENLLADRLEYSVAQMRTADLLGSASKALEHSGALKDTIHIAPLPAAGPISASTPSASQSVDQLRDCIRRTGNPDACRGKGDQ
jgi:hypothetical protein